MDPLQLTLSSIGKYLQFCSVTCAHNILVLELKNNHNFSAGSKPNLELNLWDFGSRKDDCYLGLSLAVKPSGPGIGKRSYHQMFFIL